MYDKARSIGTSHSVKRAPQKSANQPSKIPLQKRPIPNSNKTIGRTTQTLPRKTGKISFALLPSRRQSQKLVGPKAIRDCMTSDVVDTSKLPVARLSFQRKVESKLNRATSRKAICSVDDSELDYLGRLPPPHVFNDLDRETSSENSDISEKSTPQSSADFEIPRMEFASVVRQIMRHQQPDFRMQSTTLECLQEASELVLTQIFEDISSVPEQCDTLHEAQKKILKFYLDSFQSN